MYLQIVKNDIYFSKHSLCFLNCMFIIGKINHCAFIMTLFWKTYEVYC